MKVWSPGSTTNSSSSTETTIPATVHISTSQAESLPDGYRIVSTSAKTMRTIDTVSPTTSEVIPNDHHLQNIKEVYDPNQTIAPTHKYWTLPRNIATATKTQYLIEDEELGYKPEVRQSSHPQLHQRTTERHIHRQIITDQSPPPNAKYIYETEDTKYFTLPTEPTEVTTIRKVIPAPPKSEGIGPVDENGIPLALKSVRLLDLKHYLRKCFSSRLI